MGRLPRPAPHSSRTGSPALPPRHGKSPAFPDIATATGQLPDTTALDGELVVWDDDRLALERLQNRLQRRGAAATLAEWVREEWRYSCRSQPVPEPRKAVCSSISARVYPYDSLASPVSGQTPRGLTTLPGPGR